MRLTVRREGAPPETIAVPAAEATLGKSEECAVVLADPGVSRRHAKIVESGGRLFVEDLGSTNGTAVGGRTITERTEIRPGESIQIGPFVVDAAVDAAPTPAPPPVVAVGLGPLDALLADESVTEVMVNGPDEVFVERGGRLVVTDVRFASADTLREAIDGVAARAGRVIDARRPILDVRLPDGSRLNAILPPLALRGPCLTIRRFSRGGLSTERLVELGAASAGMMGFLQACVAGRQNMLVAGGTSSGKTTLLNALVAHAGPDERIVTIEDAAELQLRQRHVVPLETRAPEPDGTGAVTVRDLLRNALRMRPDRIVVGEVRGGEALDMLIAMNTGHEGSLSTIHANTPREALAQVETFVRFIGVDLPSRTIREQIVGGIRIVAQTSRASDGRRRVNSIAEVTGLEGDQITMGEIFRIDPTSGSFRATGYVPRVRERLTERGVPIDLAWFQP